MREKIPCPTSASVRQLLNQMFRLDSELDGFCIDRFLSTWRMFTNGMDRTAKTNILLIKNDCRNIIAALEGNYEFESFKHILKYEDCRNENSGIAAEERNEVELYPYPYKKKQRSKVDKSSRPRIIVRNIPDDTYSFQFSIVNPSKTTIILTDTIVNIRWVMVLANGNSLSGPTDLYSYQLILPYSDGLYRYVLPRPIKITPDDALTFNLRLIPVDESHEYDLSIGFSIDEADYFSRKRIKINW